MKKPIVLVHGAWHGSWCFEDVAGLLSNEGYDVHAVDLPLQGPADDIAAARSCIQQLPGAVVLGHSYGGLVITHAATGLDVSHLVYLAALMPDEQEDLAEKIGAAPQATALNEAMVPQDDGLVSINLELGKLAFYHDCEETVARDAMAKLRPQLVGTFPILESSPAWQHTSSTYVICRDDRALHPALQADFASRASEVVEWDGGHSPFLTQPELVTGLLAKLAM